jgi:cobalamin biosynthesis Mg chelatase CobN
MKSCPECEEQIADDAVHCGHCGAKVEERDSKQTMFGVGAVDQDELDQAVADAKEAADRAEEKLEQQDDDESGGLSTESTGSRIPRPDEVSKEDEGSTSTLSGSSSTASSSSASSSSPSSPSSSSSSASTPDPSPSGGSTARAESDDSEVQTPSQINTEEPSFEGSFGDDAGFREGATDDRAAVADQGGAPQSDPFENDDRFGDVPAESEPGHHAHDAGASSESSDKKWFVIVGALIAIGGLGCIGAGLAYLVLG